MTGTPGYASDVVPWHASLVWRLVLPNAVVLAVASVVLLVEPANGRIPVLVGGFLVLVGVNLALISRTVRPLLRLTSLMQRVDPLVPGERLPLPRQRSEVRIVAEAFNDMLDRLESERRESGSRGLREREAERRRIAAELHDQIGQMLTAIALQMDRITGRAPDDLRAECSDARDGVLATVEDVRRLASELRPETLDALGLGPALRNLTNGLSTRTGVHIERTIQPTLPALSEDEELVVFRVAQEALTNALRHADATCIELDLRALGDGVELVVQDDGRGLDGRPARPAGGIRTMRERAMSVGGTLQIGTRPDGGTRARLHLPARDAARP